MADVAAVNALVPDAELVRAVRGRHRERRVRTSQTIVGLRDTDKE